MPYKIFLLFPFAAAFLYLLLGALTTCYLRISNPLCRRRMAMNTLYLTFDDGIDSVFTPMLLDLLKKHNIKASFFVVASSIKNNIQILERMKIEGHTIGLHSLHHQNQILQLPHQLKRDFEESIEIFDNHGIKLTYYRPPWGHARMLGIYLCSIHHLQTVLWTVIVGDWQKNITPDVICKRLQEKVNGSAVICLHDGRGKNQAPLKTMQALEYMIPKWKEAGYVFKTISELY